MEKRKNLSIDTISLEYEVFDFLYACKSIYYHSWIFQIQIPWRSIELSIGHTSGLIVSKLTCGFLKPQVSIGHGTKVFKFLGTFCKRVYLDLG